MSARKFFCNLCRFNVSKKNGMKIKPLSRTFLLMLFVWGGGLALSICNEQGGEKAREKMTETGTAVVTSALPNQHEAVTYAFFVEDRKYTGYQVPAPGFLDGSTYVVHYNPGNPSSSFLGAIPTEDSGTHWTYLSIFAGIILTSAIVMFILERRGIVPSD